MCIMFKREMCVCVFNTYRTTSVHMIEIPFVLERERERERE